MQRVGRSKNPLYHQFPLMAKNLREKFEKTVCVRSEYWSYEFSLKPEINYTISFVPGFNKEDCTKYRFKTWEALLDHYYFLINKKE